MTAADTLIARLDKVKSTGPDSWVACCPAHEDKRPNLSIKQLDDRTLIHCWSGCGAADVVAAIGLSLADLFDRKPEIESPQARRRPPLPSARELLALIEFYLAVVECVFADVMFGLPFTDEDRRTAADSMRSIRRVLEVCHGYA